MTLKFIVIPEYPISSADSSDENWPDNKCNKAIEYKRNLIPIKTLISLKI
jgi:hypothetical protein